MQFYNKTIKEVLEHFKVNEEKGLDGHKIQSRRQLFGTNEIKSQKKINPLVIFLRQFRSFIIYILLFALVISMIAGEYIDSSVILIILIFNAFFGFLQEYKAEKAIRSLKKLAALQARVIRGGKQILIDAREIVPGDVLALEEGDRIPADARLIECINLQTLESSLTGESHPVSKQTPALKGTLTIADRTNIVFSGTVITKGRGKAIVTNIGMQTELGKIAGIMRDIEEETTPLQRKLHSLGKWIGLATIIICLVVFFVGILKQDILHLLLDGQYVDFVKEARSWFLVAIALAVAAVPEGLPAIVTIALALGVRKMVKRNSLIRRLPSVETLGETSVICSDKTGTITENEMTVRKAYIYGKEVEIEGEGYDLQGKIKTLKKEDLILFKIGALCNNAHLMKENDRVDVTGDPTEIALLVSASKAGFSQNVLKSHKRIKELPFESERKMMSTINLDPENKKQYMYTKGAPEEVLEKCTKILIKNKQVKLTSELKKEVLEKNDKFAKRALRVLAFAYKPCTSNKEEKDLVFVGLQGMIDPPRQEVKKAIERCKQAGIRVIMITGDNKHTAEAIAREVGIHGNALNGMDFAALSQEDQERTIQETSVFARTEPSHKMRIIDLLQKNGKVVAMTGDGVNEAPALKKADIGIAMWINGTNVT